jgi:phosphoserine phosphatase RsbU/P
MERDRFKERLQLRDFKLNALLQITKAVNDNLQIDSMLIKYQTILKEDLDVSKLILFYWRENRWNCILKYGVPEGSENFDTEKIFSKRSQIHLIQQDLDHELHNFDILIPVFHREQPLAYLLLGDVNEEEIKMSPSVKHMNFIQTLTNLIVVAIENKRLAKENIKQERMNKELELAAELQAMLVPSSLPSNEKIDMASYYRPHQQVGGDYYDYIELNENEICFCVADVSGKGISAAFIMSNFQAYLRALLNFSNSLTDLVIELNKKVVDTVKGERFITFFIAKYNYTTRLLNYVNAGHNHPMLYDGEKLSFLDQGCVGLGMLDKIKNIAEGTVFVKPNSCLLCYTDGLVEVENKQNKEFGTDEIEKIMINGYSLKMQTINNQIMETLEVFREENPYPDDIALISCRIF